MNTARCARPACSGNRAAWLAYDYEARCAWLDDDPTHTTDPAQHWPLCERHADALKVPRGWFCVDRRTARVTAEGRAGRTAGLAPGQSGQLSAIL